MLGDERDAAAPASVTPCDGAAPEAVEAPRKAGVLKRCWRRVLLGAVLLGALLWVAADQAGCPCKQVEREAERAQRLYCAMLLEANEETGRVVPGQEFRCTADGQSMSMEGWFLDVNEAGDACCSRWRPCLNKLFDSLQAWIAMNPAKGWLAFAALFAVLTVMLIPGSVLTIGAGAAFGTALGFTTGTLVASTAVVVGGTVGAVIAFLMGRYLVREHVEAWSSRYKLLKAIDGAFETKGLTLVVLMRLSPVLPFNVFNFVIGCTKCSLWDYTVGSIVGVIPGVVAFVVLGALVSSVSFGPGMRTEERVSPRECKPDPNEMTIRTVVLVVGVLATLLAVVCITLYARRHLREIEAQAEAQSEPRPDDDARHAGARADPESPSL